MTDLPADLSARVAKLLPRLASNHNGEIAATASAIGRVLQAGGRDWHDLAQHVAEKPREVIRFIERSPREAPAYPFGAWRDAYARPSPNAVHRARVSGCQAAAGARSAWENQFLTSLAQQLAKGRTLTAKQAAILDDIAVRLGVAA